MRHALMLLMLLTLMTACGQSGPQSGQGGSATGPSVTVHCRVTAAGGGTVGDTTVNVDCPEDNSETTTAPTN